MGAESGAMNACASIADGGAIQIGLVPIHYVGGINKFIPASFTGNL